MKYILCFILPIILFASNHKKININNSTPTKLQCPNSHSSNCSKKYFNNLNNETFYFYICGKYKRSELRFLDEFKFNEKTQKVLIADFEIIKLNKAFTFLQIHTKKGINKPILRIAIYNKKLKIFIFDGKKYTKYVVKKFKNISEIKHSHVHVEIKIKKDILYIYIKIKNKQSNFKTKIYDKKDKMYFKIGVYLQRKNCAEVKIFNILYY